VKFCHYIGGESENLLSMLVVPVTKALLNANKDYEHDKEHHTKPHNTSSSYKERARKKTLFF